MTDLSPSPAPGGTPAVSRDNLHAVLAQLNARVPFRFTGVYRFDGALLRNVALFDRVDPAAPRGADAPLGETYCAITGRLNDALLVSDGRRDPRYAWMRANAVISYCGVPIRSEAGQPLGTLCHFDLAPWPSQGNEASFLLCIADTFRCCLG
jgi:GAF domain-containing protein